MKSCLNCGGNHLRRFINLGDQPNGNHFLAPSEIESELRFPFSMSVCTDCWQVQLEEFPSQEYMFGNHPYITGLNVPILSHFRTLVDKTIFKYEIDRNSLVIDIGANDGTLLEIFRDKGMRVLGVDPCSRTGKLSSHKGITVAKQFWNKQTAAALKHLHLDPKLITATAVFYHIPNLHEFIQGLKVLMKEDTIFLAQCVYMKDILENFQFDHFYHEHTIIHSVAPLKSIFERYGMKIINVDMSSVHGGSFILEVVLDESPYQVDESVNAAIELEISAGMNIFDTYKAFTQKVEKNRDELLDLLISLNSQGKTVYALGAPLKGSTLLNYCNIGPNLVQCAVEVNQFKIGKVTPGTHIPVVEESSLIAHPDYYLVLSWNYLDFFRSKYSHYLASGGKFIVPHPEVNIIDR